LDAYELKPMRRSRDGRDGDPVDPVDANVSRTWPAMLSDGPSAIGSAPTVSKAYSPTCPRRRRPK
jgi:hypothetical protein